MGEQKPRMNWAKLHVGLETVQSLEPLSMG